MSTLHVRAFEIDRRRKRIRLGTLSLVTNSFVVVHCHPLRRIVVSLAVRCCSQSCRWTGFPFSEANLRLRSSDHQMRVVWISIRDVIRQSDLFLRAFWLFRFASSLVSCSFRRFLSFARRQGRAGRRKCRPIRSDFELQICSLSPGRFWRCFGSGKCYVREGRQTFACLSRSNAHPFAKLRSSSLSDGAGTRHAADCSIYAPR